MTELRTPAGVAPRADRFPRSRPRRRRRVPPTAPARRPRRRPAASGAGGDDLKLAREALDADAQAGLDLLDEALHQAERASTDLRETVRGILPAALARSGLEAGLRSRVADLPLPVDIDVAIPRLDPAIETAAYFVVTEALTNVIKHPHATYARVTAAFDGSGAEITVTDDGVGGADSAGGSGLVGLRDRVVARE